MAKVSDVKLAQIQNALSSKDFKNLMKKSVAERSLKKFVEYGWPSLHPDIEFQDSPHLDYLCAKLEQFAMDFLNMTKMHRTHEEWMTAHSTKKNMLQINIPPRSID